MNLKKQREKYFLKQTKEIKKTIEKKIKYKYCNGEQGFTISWDHNIIVFTDSSNILEINIEKAKIIIDEYLKRNKIKYIVSSHKEGIFNHLVYEFVEDNNDL